MAGISNTYDPTSTAQAMAESFTSGRQTILTRQTQTASATEKALGTLGSALNTFQSSLLGMTGVNKTISAYSAAFSDTSVASATAGATATAGSYAFFVKQVASAQKLSYSSMSDFAGQGSLTLGAGSNSFTLQLNTKPNWSVRDLAAAINAAPGNTSVSASVVSTGIVNGVPTSELVLTSKQTGANNAISLSTSGVDANLATRLGAPAELAKPLDAIVNVGSEGGTEIRQASNTLNVIDGVTMTLSKAQTTGSAPVTLTVATDPSKTTSNAQAFVDAYNKLKSAIDGLVSPGDPTAGDAAGAFSGDSGVRALRDRLVGMLRGSGSTSLASFGILAARDGSLSLDSARMNKALASNPTGLDALIGSTAAGSTSGIAGQLDSYLKLWTNSADGQIGRRKEVVGKLQGDLTERQTALDRQYDSAYKRYLTQFTQLQSVQSSMSYNTSLFDALFSSAKD